VAREDDVHRGAWKSLRKEDSAIACIQQRLGKKEPWETMIKGAKRKEVRTGGKDQEGEQGWETLKQCWGNGGTILMVKRRRFTRHRRRIVTRGKLPQQEGTFLGRGGTWWESLNFAG